MYNPDRVDLIKDSARLIGATEAAYKGSRKPLVVQFKEKTTGHELACINVHLASKRHQLSIFAPEQPGYDARLQVRVQQAAIIEEQLAIMRKQGLDYYVTGDFNDTEESETLAAITGDENINLVMLLPPGER